MALKVLSLLVILHKSGNTSKNLLNKIRKIIYSLSREKEITRKVYNNNMLIILMNSIKVQYKNEYYIYEF